MATKYWIKLYHEIIDDRKMGQLPDTLWRRFVECCLFAGEMGFDDDDPQKGRLPDISDMAWRLRVDEKTLSDQLQDLARRGLLDYRADTVLDGYWFVVAFAARQSPMKKAEYMRRKRREDAKPEPLPNSYQSVTNGNADKIRIDKDKIQIADAAAGKVFSTYEDNIGALTPALSDSIGAAIDEHGADTVQDAIREAVKYNARSWAYVEKVLGNWRANGRNPKQNGAPAEGDILEKILTAVSRYGRDRGMEAKETFTPDEWRTVTRMGGWYNLCAMTPDKIQISYYSARKAAAHV
jgi:DnaD/phage-associated family protein